MPVTPPHPSSGGRPARPPAFAVLLLLLLAPVEGPRGIHAQERAVMGHEAYEIWKTIADPALSPDGEWAYYGLELEDGDGTLVVQHLDSDREIRVPRGTAAAFSADSRFVVFRIRPHLQAARAARREGRPQAEHPGDSLGIVQLSDGEVTRIPGVRSFRLPSEGGGRVVYQLSGERGPSSEGGAVVLRELDDGQERRFPRGVRYDVAANGALVGLVQREEQDTTRVRIVAVRPASDEETELAAGRLDVPALTVGRQGRQLAFLTVPGEAAESVEPAGDRSAAGPSAPEANVSEDGPPDAPTVRAGRETAPAGAAIHHWRVGSAAPALLATAGTSGLPEGWGVNRHATIAFSRSGQELYFGTAPGWLRDRPEPGLAEEEVRVDVWHWRDGDLMTVQLVNEVADRRRSYTAVAHLTDGGRVVQLGTLDVPEIRLPAREGGRHALGLSEAPYALEASWDSPRYRDLVAVDLRTGETRSVAERSQGSPVLSPGGRYITWYEPQEERWLAHDLPEGRTVDLSQGIPWPVRDEDHDQPSPAGSYGAGGWTEGDGLFLVHDRYDVWAVDPGAPTTPRSLTRGQGRTEGVRYRVLRLDRERDALPASGPLLASAFRESDKSAGFARITADGGRPPETLVLSPHRYSTPVQARERDRILYTRESFRDFPDLWVSDPSFRSPRRFTDANPQQAGYRWGDVELVRWTSGDGATLEGVLMKPEDFDPAGSYPLIVYFYERWSDGLHNHYAPVPHRSRISFPMYTSRGYLVFIPDIVYRDGYPGEGAMNAVVPGVMHLLDRGYVDRARMGLQGHSWGGYQISFMVTRTGTLFRAAAPGAPVANMTSAYGGIRRETGLVRQFQYERTQSRLGGSLWERPLRYLENSPLFWADRIETPLLILHNDGDGHVPWEQGIELFTALRRLGKPAWLINYNDQPHWPLTFPNRRDWNIRLQEFFDHYLKDTPAPAWMEEGVPAALRGR